MAGPIRAMASGQLGGGRGALRFRGCGRFGCAGTQLREELETVFAVNTLRTRSRVTLGD